MPWGTMIPTDPSGVGMLCGEHSDSLLRLGLGLVAAMDGKHSRRCRYRSHQHLDLDRPLVQAYDSQQATRAAGFSLRELLDCEDLALSRDPGILGFGCFAQAKACGSGPLGRSLTVAVLIGRSRDAATGEVRPTFRRVLDV